MQQQSVSPNGGVAFVALLAFVPGAAALVSTNTTLEVHDSLLIHEDAGRLRDHPPGADYRKETEVARISLTAEAMIAFVWIMMVCSVPLVAIKLEGKRLTRSQVSIFVVMWITFLAGIYLFTNVLLFESVHFEGERSLTIVECVYLFSQILTTVGYGDIIPARPRAQVFVGLYVLFTLVIIANVLSDVTELITKQTQEYYAKLQETISMQLLVGLPSLDEEEEERKEDETDIATGRTMPREVLRKFIRARLPSLQWKSLARTSGMFFVWCAVGVVFFNQYPGEGRSLFEAAYFSVITLSTVGFGVYTPLTEAGKVFGAFWMLFGSATLVAVVGAFTELMAEIKVRERFITEFSQGELIQTSTYESLPERVDLYEFTRFALLSAKYVQEDTLTLIDKTFDELGPSEEGQISKEAVQTMLEDLRKQDSHTSKEVEGSKPV